MGGAPLEEFLAGLPFEPDGFQLEAFEAVAAGETVVVTAPTGAGKTLVAEAAVHLALHAGARAFYTTPLKALSNQKFGDFKAVYGDGAVGLLTGDNSVNGDAPVVVMTTEVLRNMIYADSSALDGLGVVVLDEVHYLQDRFRGMVWEEIVIHLPLHVPLVALSATISNAGEFTEWVASRRGGARLVEETHRPVPLDSEYLVKDRSRTDPLVLLPVFARGARPNPQVERLLRESRRRHTRFRTPRRWEVAELLRDHGLLPAIYFIFSRAGCDAAAEQVASGLRLTAPEERSAIREVAERRTAHLHPQDLAVLGYGRWLELLERGIAAHHAGLVPAFKEAVEELFQRGLVRLVFATETLSLGINMPARTVVLESLSKFTGESHELLRPGEYTQLTGRAGRRGIDTLGTAVVLHSRFVPFDRVAAIAAAGSHPLVSAFRPNYNMAANLVANYDRAEAEELVEASFGQFRRARERTRLAAVVEELESQAAEFREQAACERGDVWEFLAAGDDPAPSHRTVMRSFAQELTAGDVLEPEPGGRPREVMLARGFGSNPRLLLLSTAGKLRRVDPKVLPESTIRVGRIELPEPFSPRDAGYQRDVAARLRAWKPDGEEVLAAAGDDAPPGHPVAGCPRLDEHRSWARRARRAERDLARRRSRLARAGGGMLDEFRSILALLGEWGYADGWALTEAGEQLRAVYNERDLLVTEAVRTGLFDGLGPPALAALASTFVYDPRREVQPGRWPNRELEERWRRLEELAGRLADAEARRRLAETPPPEPGFAESAYYWTAGIELEDLLDDDLAAGDFVRTCRQLLDLLIQLRTGFPAIAETADEAVRAVNRGVVAAGGVG